MDTGELDRLIIDHLEDLDGTAKRIAKIEERMWREIAECLTQWAKAQGWAYGVDPDDDYWVAPLEWIEDGEPWAWFGVGWGPGDTGEGAGEEPYFHLARLAGAAGGRLALWLGFNGIRARTYKPLFRGAAEEFSAAGFLLDDNSDCFTDCSLRSAEVAAGLADDDLSAALGPLVEGLKRCRSAWPVIDKPLRLARGS